MTTKSLTILILFGVIIFSLLIYIAFFSKWVVNSNTQSIISNNSEGQIIKNKELVSEISATPEDLSSELISLDQTWNLYKNKKFGFSMKAPKTVYDFGGSDCVWNDVNDHSYRSGGGFVPVKIIEEENEIFITTEYFYEPVGETCETCETTGNGRKYYSGCQKVVFDSAYKLIDKERQHDYWRILIKKIDDESQLDFFIKEKYGGGCSYGGKTPSAQSGVYDIVIKGVGLPGSDSNCLVNGGTLIKYHPTSNILVSWGTGQAYTFVGDDKNEITYDKEMVDSFMFK